MDCSSLSKASAYGHNGTIQNFADITERGIEGGVEDAFDTLRKTPEFLFSVIRPLR